MAFDGIVLSNIIHELNQNIVGGKIEKIYQPEKEELLITVRNNRINHKLLLNSNSEYPRIHLTQLSKNQSNTPPMFCMLLRKHLIGGKIIEIKQPNFERIVEIHIQAKNELGDTENKVLILEIMGRHSNLILTKQNLTILDSIKHISYDKSQVRQVLPNHMYIYPPNQSKLNPLDTNKEEFIDVLLTKNSPVHKALYQSYSGISPLISSEICSEIDGSQIVNTLNEGDFTTLYQKFTNLMDKVKSKQFIPIIYMDNDELPIEYYSFELIRYNNYNSSQFATMSETIEYYTHNKSQKFTISQKTSDIKKMVTTFLDRSIRKQALQEQALEKSEKSDIYKIYGELITSYSYSINQGDKSFTTINYYSDEQEEITIPLDEAKTPIENAQSYFKTYNKLKRTAQAAIEQLAIIKEDLEYLKSVLISIDLLESEMDIAELRQELVDMGYLKKRTRSKQKPQKNQKPYMHFQTSTGLDVYVGKNNLQNDALTMKFAKANDIWLHIKSGAGSHVIIKIPHQYEPTEQDLYEGAMLAGYYSSGQQSSNVQIDYTTKKNVKKIPNAKPGMVIYNNFKTITVTPTNKLVTSLQV